MIHLMFRFRDQQFFLVPCAGPSEAHAVIGQWAAVLRTGHHGVITGAANGVPWAVGTEHLMFVHAVTPEDLQAMAGQAAQAARPQAPGAFTPRGFMSGN